MKYTIPCALLMALTSICYSAEPLNNAAGKLFDVNPATRTARFLKQDVKIDPETGARTPWHTIQWSDKTTFAITKGKEVVTPEQLAKGSWKATLNGKMVDDKFVVDTMDLGRLDDRLATDDPKLPRVLSVGDSISMNYYNSAKEGLKGIANYHKIEDNCWSVHRGMTFISYWLGDYKKEGRGWDVVLVNSGMHDMKQKKLRGPYAVSLDVYKKFLEQEIKITKETGATVIFVTTTPVQNDSGNANYAFRSKGAEKDFNKAAREMLKAHPDVHILDLAKVVNESKVLDNWRKGTEIHYWKAHESAVLGKAVAEKIKEVMAAKKAK